MRGLIAENFGFSAKRRSFGVYLVSDVWKKQMYGNNDDEMCDVEL